MILMANEPKWNTRYSPFTNAFLTSYLLVKNHRRTWRDLLSLFFIKYRKACASACIGNFSDVLIHFLFTVEDSSWCSDVYSQPHFNPLPIRRGRRLNICEKARATIFQSTFSIQRKTKVKYKQGSESYISIHFLYTEEDKILIIWNIGAIISIHFLYTEEDNPKLVLRFFLPHFNPLPLHRGRRI